VALDPRILREAGIMAIQIVTAEQRQASAKTSLAIFGPFGVGKTSLLKHLPADYTLFLDIEAGMKSVEPWPGASFPVKAFSDFQDFVALVAGPKPDAAPAQWYSTQHYEHVAAAYRGTLVEEYAAKPVIFVDSITKLTRLAMTFAQQQPEALSEKTGRPDIRGAYGLLAREVIGALEHLQQAPGKTLVFVGLLEKVTGDYGAEWVPQMEGSKAGRELPGIVDQVISMHTFSRDMSSNYVLDEKAEERRFVCKKGNPFGLPAKDRSGRLDMTEAPDLGALLRKINGKS
jgi:hypothetical protein